MAQVSDFNEGEHPRDQKGQFATKPQGAPSRSLDADSVSQVIDLGTSGLCYECAEEMVVDSVGVSYHTNASSVLFDADADHTAILDESSPSAQFGSKDGLLYAYVPDDAYVSDGSPYVPDCSGCADIEEIRRVLEQYPDQTSWHDMTYEVTPVETDPEGSTTTFSSDPFFIDGDAHFMQATLTAVPYAIGEPDDRTYGVKVEEHYQVCEMSGQPTGFNLGGDMSVVANLDAEYGVAMSEDDAVEAAYQSMLEWQPGLFED